MQKFRQWLTQKHFLADDYLAKAEKRPYKLFQIKSSLKCGLSCVMCPWSGLRASAGVMAWTTFERIADNFQPHRKRGFNGRWRAIDKSRHPGHGVEGERGRL